MASEVIELKQRKASFIGNPKSNTVLYIVKKIEDKLVALETVDDCLVFAEEGINIPDSLKSKHNFVYTKNPVLAYANYAQKIADEHMEVERQLKYELTPGGYYLGDGVSLGSNVYIEPGALIGHGVKLGSNTMVLAGSVIKNAKIGENCLIKEYALIGGQAFTLASGDEGDVYRVQCLGDVVIEDHVEIGSFTTICRGSNTSTTIGKFAKVDDHVHVGHDITIDGSAIITAGTVLGGYDHIGKGAYVGMNATIKQMVNVEAGAFVSMGARVAKDVKCMDGNFGFPVKK